MMFDLTRGIAVAALLGTAAFGTAQATEWKQLQGSTWGGAEAGASADADAGDGMASSDTDASAGAAVEIALAFHGLGMSEARAECYGAILADKLSPDDEAAAAELVRTAANGDDVRSAVLNAGPMMVGGFSAADASCPDDMGG